MYIIKLIIFIIIAIIIAIIYLPVLCILYPWHIRIGPLLLQFACKFCLGILNVKIIHADQIKTSVLKDKGIILLSNHVNMLDILLLSALYRTVFISKIEVVYWPLFGQLAFLVGTIFLKRNSPMHRHKLIRAIAKKSRGRIITIFPQGTTSSFADPLPFKCGIFKTVEINPDIILVPVTIHYKEEDEIAWTKNQVLLLNIKNIASQKRIHIKVKIHNEITFKDYSDKTISEICRMTQERVLTRLWDDDQN